jgi:hypothetical protein
VFTILYFFCKFFFVVNRGTPCLKESGKTQHGKYTQNASFTVRSSTNVFSPVTNWTAIGTASNIGPNLFEFTETNPPTDPQRFYRVRSP